MERRTSDDYSRADVTRFEVNRKRQSVVEVVD
jgi:hypothetical protein